MYDTAGTGKAMFGNAICAEVRLTGITVEVLQQAPAPDLETGALQEAPCRALLGREFLFVGQRRRRDATVATNQLFKSANRGCRHSSIALVDWAKSPRPAGSIGR